MSNISYIYGTENDKYNAYTIYRDGIRLEAEPLAEYIEKLESRIAELKAKQRWTPVSEQPKETGEYITLKQKEGKRFVDTAGYTKNNDLWWCEHHVTHWMPLPELPEDTNDEPA